MILSDKVMARSEEDDHNNVDIFVEVVREFIIMHCRYYKNILVIS